MAKVVFENGVTVNFDGEPTPQDIEEVASQFSAPAPQFNQPEMVMQDQSGIPTTDAAWLKQYRAVEQPKLDLNAALNNNPVIDNSPLAGMTRGIPVNDVTNIGRNVLSSDNAFDKYTFVPQTGIALDRDTNQVFQVNALPKEDRDNFILRYNIDKYKKQFGDEFSGKQSIDAFGTKLVDLFGVQSLAANKAPADSEGKAKWLAMQELAQERGWNDPAKYAGLVGDVGRMALEFGAIGKGLKVVSKAVPALTQSVNAAQAARRIPGGTGTLFAATQAANPNTWIGQTPSEAIKGLGESYLMGGAVGATGELIPNPLVRTPVVAAGFGGLTYAQTRDINASIESALTVLAFESPALLGKFVELTKTKPTEAVGLIRRYGKANLATVPDNVILGLVDTYVNNPEAMPKEVRRVITPPATQDNIQKQLPTGQGRQEPLQSITEPVGPPTPPTQLSPEQIARARWEQNQARRKQAMEALTRLTDALLPAEDLQMDIQRPQGVDSIRPSEPAYSQPEIRIPPVRVPARPQEVYPSENGIVDEYGQTPTMPQNDLPPAVVPTEPVKAIGEATAKQEIAEQMRAMYQQGTVKDVNKQLNEYVNNGTLSREEAVKLADAVRFGSWQNPFKQVSEIPLESTAPTIIGQLPKQGDINVAHFDTSTGKIYAYAGHHADIPKLENMGLTEQEFLKKSGQNIIQGGFVDSNGKFYTDAKEALAVKQSQRVQPKSWWHFSDEVAKSAQKFKTDREGILQLTKETKQKIADDLGTTFANADFKAAEPDVAGQLKFGDTPENRLGNRKNFKPGFAYNPIPDMIEVGKKIYDSGKTKLIEWANEMRRVIGEHITPYIKDAWKNLQELSKKERGGFVGFGRPKSEDYGIGKSGVNYDAKSTKDTPLEKTKSNLEYVAGKVGEMFRPVDSRLEEIAKPLFQGIRHIYHKIPLEIQKSQNEYQALAKGISKMSSSDKEAFKLSAMNGDTEIRDKILNKYNLTEAYDQFEKEQYRILQEKRAVGIDTGELPDRFPRHVKDLKAFDKFMNTDNSPIARAIKTKEAKIGRKLTVEEKTILTNSLLRGYKVGGERLTPGSSKERTVESITPQMSKLYSDPIEALNRDIIENWTAIERRRFLGKEPENISKLRQQKATILTTLAKKPDDSTRVKLESKLETVNQALQGADKDLAESIGARVQEAIDKGEMDAHNATEARAIISDLFNERPQGKITSAIHTTMMTDIMNGIGTAIKTSSDIATTAAEHPIEYLKAASRGILNKYGIDIEKDLGISDTSPEFQKSIADIVRKFELPIFNLVNWTAYAQRANTYFEVYKNWAKSGNAKLDYDLERYFSSPQDRTMTKAALRDGIKSSGVKELLWNKMADLYPLSSAQKTRTYLRSPIARTTFLALKNFFIKQFDYVRMESVKKMKDPRTRAEGIRNLAYLPMIILAANMGTNAAYDAIRGRKLDDKYWTDSAIENMLQFLTLGMVNRYTIDAVQRHGSAALASGVIPASTYADEVVNIIKKKEYDQFYKHIPLVGKYIYSKMHKPKPKKGVVSIDRYGNIRINPKAKSD